MDNCILVSKDKSAIEESIDSLKQGPENFIFTDKGDLNKYRGIKNEKLYMERILQAMDINTCMTNYCPMPVVGPLLNRDTAGPDRKHDLRYRRLTGMLGYLQQTLCPETSMATHQCTHFNNNPKLCHEHAVKQICKYLLGTMDKGLVFTPDVTCGLKCYVDQTLLEDGLLATTKILNQFFLGQVL